MRALGSGEPAESFRPAAIVLAVGLVGWGAATRSHAVDSAATFCMLAAAVAVLCSAVFLYVFWHIGEDTAVAWLATASAAYAVQLLNWYVLIVEDPGNQGARTPWAGLFQALVTVGLGLLVLRGDRLPVRYDPLAVGLLGGLAIIVVRLAFFALPLPDATFAGYVVALTALLTVSAWLSLRFLRSAILSADLRWRIALSILLLGVGRAMAIVEHPSTWVLTVDIVANTIGGALLLGTAAALARLAVVDETKAVRVLRSRLETAELELHTDQEKMHEIRSTLAGISTATELLHRTGVSPSRREQLHDMTASELRRLQRMVGRRQGGLPSPVELDEALGPVVQRHRIEGLPVVWKPTGHVAVGRADDVAEIVNVLLSNARRHVGRRPVTVDVRAQDDRVELAVTDCGPGVAPDVRSSLFQWGAHGPGSPGEGIGLAAARLLAGSLGGDLRLEPDRGRGATFVLSLVAGSRPALHDVLP